MLLFHNSLHKTRKEMAFENRYKLGGIIEVDESSIGSGEKGGKRGRGTKNKILVAVGVELTGSSQLGRIRINAIPDASGDSLHRFVQGNIEISSKTITDGWAGYSLAKG
ncbi:MAG: IS1595 family transposase [Eubacteriaceae bacterium]|nr:IS1595 family transposase [Eubacteriaceae bacterium]